MASSKTIQNHENSQEALTQSLRGLIEKGRRDGTIQSSELMAILEKIDLSVEKIEEIYENFESMGIQIVGDELELDSELTMDEDSDELILLDQTRLPNEESTVAISTARALYDAIRRLQVRGAPAIGVAAALGLYACAVRFEDETPEGFLYSLRKTKAFIASARPTAQNLFWALERTERAAGTGTIPEMLARIRAEALAIFEEDIAICRAIGENGLSLLHPGDGLLTHCNAGALATVRFGTATAPIYLGHARGYDFSVYADETRPLLQGARLTAFELARADIRVTLECDDMSASLMRTGAVQAVLVGCDRVAANGDFANKIGTFPLALAAKHFGIPFYVCAPLSTVDFSCKSGAEIPIEQRKSEEVTELFYTHRMTAQGVGVYNPAFDVTDAALVTAFVTEAGIARPPFDRSLFALRERAHTLNFIS